MNDNLNKLKGLYDPKFEKTMDVANRIMARDRDALKKLAE